jgi:hypothetical protein
MQLVEGVQKNILNQVINFSAWHASEQNAVHERRVKIVELAENLAVAVPDCFDERNLDGHFRCPFGGSFCQWIHQEHVGSRHDGD